MNDTGRAQALAVRDQLKNVNVSAIYSSDLLRSRQTAALLAQCLGLTISLEPRFREMHLGVWEGMLSHEIKTQFPQEWGQRMRDPLNTRAPQGESPKEVAQRVIPTINEIAANHRNKTVLIIAHGISLAVITCQARGIPLEYVYENIPNNAKPCHVQWNC